MNYMDLWKILVLALTIAQQVAADQPSDPKPANLLKTLCRNQDVQDFSHNTVVQLLKFINSPSEHIEELDGCIGRLKQPIAELLEIIYDPEHNICGQRRVSKVAKFHWKYVIGGLDEKWAIAMSYNIQMIPDQMLSFFINYMNQVTFLCAGRLDQTLANMAPAVSQSVMALISGSVGSSLDTAKSMLVAYKDIKHHDSFLLLWQAVINKLRRRGKMAIDEVDDDGDNIFALVRVPEAKDLWTMQDTCRYKLRPIYQETVLPFMRLIDMGYTLNLNLNEGISEHRKAWYSVTQICELLLGAEFLEDPSIKHAELVKPGSRVQLDAHARHAFQPRRSISSPEQPSSLFNDLALARHPHSYSQLNETLRQRIKSRAALFRGMLKNLFRFTRSHPKAALKNLVASAKSRFSSFTQQIDHDDELMMQQSEILLEQDDDDDEGSARVNLEVGNKLMASKRLVSFTLYVLVPLALVLALSFVPRLG